MSAYCGLISFKEATFTENIVQGMLDTLDYWTSDHRSVYITPEVGFGHLMRYDMPESRQEIIPFENEEMVFVGDCRIDNRSELASELYLLPTDRDSLFVIAAYKLWGDRCCDHLIGDFSFVIWDKIKRHVFCGRDHIGIKPLYYYYGSSFFAFSTEVKAILCISDIPKIRNKDRESIFFSKELLSTAPYSEHTWFDNIIQLTPGHVMKVSAEGLSKFNYWDIENLPPLHLSETEFSKTLKKLVTQAVACRMRSANQVACELSGGLDSSLITAIASKINPDIHTITHIPPFEPSPFLNEASFATEVCDYLGVYNRHTVDDKDYDPEHSLQSVLHRLDGPESAMVVMYKEPVWIKAQSLQCGVVLSGFGGDECLSESGHSYLRELAKTFRWERLFRHIQLQNRQKGLGFLKSIRSWVSTIAKVQFPVVMDYYSEWKNPCSLKLPSYLSEINKTYLKGSTAFLIQALTGNDRNRCHYVRHVVNAHSVAVKEVSYRFPLLDVRLLEFVLRIPPEKRYPLGSHRYLMRQVMEGLLPNSIVNRRDKAGTIFPAAYYRWLRYYENKTGNSMSYLNPTWEKSRSNSSQMNQDILRYKCFLLELAYSISFDFLKRSKNSE